MQTSSRRFASACALFFCAVLAQGQQPQLKPPVAGKASVAGAQLPVTISADKLEGFANQETTALGNAELQQGDISIHADRLTYFYATDEVQASGNVRVMRAGDRLSGTGLRLRVKDNIGQYEQADYEFTLRRRAGYTATRARGNAELMEAEGKDKYRLKNATFTTCEPGNSDWYLQAGELDLDMTRDLGTARNGKLVFKGTPIAYTPWIDFPLHNQRKSGLLPPSIGSTGKSGFEVTTPYYLNLAPNRDLTIAPREYSKRGFQLNADFRYLDASYDGNVKLERMANDRVTSTSRHATTFLHNQRFSSNLTGYLNLNKVSDDNYFRDLSSRIAITSQAVLPRDGALTYGGGWWAASVRAQRWQTLRDPLIPVTEPYGRVPQFTFNATRQFVGGVDLSVASEFVKFDHPTNILGSRLTVYPSASLPLIRPGAFLTPKLGFHSTSYSLERNPTGIPDTLSRALPIASLDSGLIFERDTLYLGQNFRQTLEPRMFFVYAPFRDQSKIPLFDTGIADFNYAQIFSENVFSGGDRIGDAYQTTIAATTRILSPASGQELIKATFGQRHYFKNQQVILNDATQPRTDKSSNFLAGVTGRLSREWNLDTALQYDPHRNFLDRLGVGARYQPEISKALNLGYRFVRSTDQTAAALSQVDVSAQWPLGGGWSGVGRYNYSVLDGRLVEGLGGFEYNGGCWIGRVVVQRFASATGTFTNAVFFQLELNGFSRIGSNPLETLKRNIPGYGRRNQTGADTQPFDFLN